MQANNTPEPRQPWEWIAEIAAWAFAAFVMAAMVLSCNPSKRAQRKDDAAVLRVNANADLQGRVVNPWMKAHPQVIQPEVRYIKGDSVIVPVKDVGEIQRIRDSISQAVNGSDTIDCRKAVLNAFNLAWNQAEDYYRVHPFIRVDTTLIKEKDLSEINRITDSLQRWWGMASMLQGKVSVLQEDKQKDAATIAGLNKKITIDKIWIWAIVALAVLSHIFRSKIPLLNKL